MKISFDFDATLSREGIQRIAKFVIKKGFDTWIVTSRYNPNNPYNKQTSQDLFKIAENVGISKKNIIFTNQQPKYIYLQENNFLCHLDDDIEEINLIKKFTKIKAILV